MNRLAARPVLFALLMIYFGFSPIRAQEDFWAPFPSAVRGVISLTCDSRGDVFAGTSENGLYRSIDHGLLWTSVNDSSMRIEAIAGGPDGIVIAGIYRSSDYGQSWSRLPLPSPTASPSQYHSITATPGGQVYMGVFDPEDSTGGLIYFSSDRGSSWSDITAGLDSTLVYSIVRHSSGALVAGCIFGRIFIDRARLPNEWFFDGGLRISNDTGHTWVYPAVLHRSTISSLRENSHAWLFAGTFYDGIYRSVDTGKTWTQINTGLLTSNQRHIMSCVISPGGKIFIGTLGGVFVSTDNGDHWNALNTGLLDTLVYDMTIDSAGFLYAGTASGVVRSNVPIASMNDSQNFPMTINLLHNYPNPLNSTTTIEFELSVRTHVEIEIYDMIGHKVAGLLNGSIGEGIHRLIWDARNQSSGCYLLRVRAGTLFNTNKLVVVK